MRCLVLLLASLLLLAAPAGSLCAETCTDAAAESSACDALLTHVAVAAPRSRPHTLLVARRDAAIPMPPALARIFRPPRPAIA